MFRYLLLAFLSAAILPASALAEAGDRDGDQRFSSGALSAQLSGTSLIFFDGSVASYASDGAYRYVYEAGGPVFAGSWSTDDQSRVCVVFDNGFDRCDRIVEAIARLVLITDEGLRFPVRDVSAD